MNFDLTRATLLALIQGVTEFLPISSSAHLILPSQLLGWEDQGLAFDIAVHLGTLLAVLLYFRRDLVAIAAAMLAQVLRGEQSASARLGWQLLLATIPVAVAGIFLKDLVESSFRSIAVIATTTLLFGLLLWLADRHANRQGTGTALQWKGAIVVGLAQVLSLVPGTSRSGITMTAALFVGLDRQEASRFSFLLSIPVTAGAALLLFFDQLGTPVDNWGELAYGLVVAGLSAYACIHFFLKLITTLGFMPFVIYRLMLGLVLLFLVVA